MYLFLALMACGDMSVPGVYPCAFADGKYQGVVLDGITVNGSSNGGEVAYDLQGNLVSGEEFITDDRHPDWLLDCIDVAATAPEYRGAQ